MARFMKKDGRILCRERSYRRKLRRMTLDQLVFVLTDAEKALAAMPEGRNAGYYRSEIRVILSELRKARVCIAYSSETNAYYAFRAGK